MIQIPSWTYIFQSADVQSKFAQFTNRKIVFPDAAFPNLTWVLHFLVSHSSLALKVLQTATELAIAGMIHKETHHFPKRFWYLLF